LGLGIRAIWESAKKLLKLHQEILPGITSQQGLQIFSSSQNFFEKFNKTLPKRVQIYD
jgi:hypothetical protein